MSEPIDPEVELLPDVPIAGAAADLFARGAVARRLVELALAAPEDAPRVVALTGGAGTGKTSLLRIAQGLLTDAPDVAFVVLDGAGHAGAQGLLDEMIAELSVFFAAAGVVDTSDSLRDRLAEYGGVVSNIARIARINVDIAGVVRRSPEQVRQEIAVMTQEVGKRIVVVIDHVDRLPRTELASLVHALRYWSGIPYVAFVLTLDRRAVAGAFDDVGDMAMERLVQVELALPAVDRTLLARVLAGGMARVGNRTGRDVDPALDLFDPDGGVALQLIETPRDAKRAVNAVTAALPLIDVGADLRDAVLELLLRLLVPELDGPRLDRRARECDPESRAALFQELAALVEHHRRGPGAIAVLRELLLPS